MSEPLESVLCFALATIAILAEMNLLRVFMRDWLEGNRDCGRSERDRTEPTPSGTRRDSATPIAIGAALVLSGSALAQTPQAPTASASPTGQAPSTQSPTTPISSPATESPAAVERAHAHPTISTDRPSFSDTAGIAPVGHLQLETGYTFIWRDRNGTETQRHNAPELLARVGLVNDRFELRLATSGYVWSRTRSPNDTESQSSEGWSDLAVGVKFKLTDQAGALPRLAISAATTTGAGSAGISSRRAEPTFKLIWSYDLEALGGAALKGFGVYGNINASWSTSEGARYWQGAASICGTYAISDRWGVFAEYYAVFPASKGSGSSHSIDAGTSYLLTPRVQLDARVGVGLNETADNLFAGVGFSVLF